MNKAIVGVISVIAVVSWLVFFFGGLYILVLIGLPWWIMVAPGVIVGLVALGVVNKHLATTKAAPLPK